MKRIAIVLLFCLGPISTSTATSMQDIEGLIHSKDKFIQVVTNEEQSIYYAGADFDLTSTKNGQPITWSIQPLSAGSGDLIIKEVLDKKTEKTLTAKLTRGKLGEPTRRFSLIAQFTRKGKEVNKEYQIYVLSKPLRVMTWNIWGKEGHKTATQPIEPEGGEFNYRYLYHYKAKDTNQRDRVAAVINESGADIVLLQETYGQIDFLKENTSLKYSFGGEGRGASISVLSRFPIDKEFTLGSDSNYLGAEIKLSESHEIAAFSSHFTSKDSNWQTTPDTVTDHQGIEIDKRERMPAARELISYVEENNYLKNADQTPVLIGGDHNAISHLDYVASTIGKPQNYGRGIIAAPVSMLFTDNGFTDSYRQVNPDPLEYPCLSYSSVYLQAAGPVKAGDWPADRPHFRIDYIYSKGSKLVPVESKIINTFDGKVLTYPEFDSDNKLTKRGVYIFPSDHAAILSTYEWLD